MAEETPPPNGSAEALLSPATTTAETATPSGSESTVEVDPEVSKVVAEVVAHVESSAAEEKQADASTEDLVKQPKGGAASEAESVEVESQAVPLAEQADTQNDDTGASTQENESEAAEKDDHEAAAAEAENEPNSSNAEPEASVGGQADPESVDAKTHALPLREQAGSREDTGASTQERKAEAAGEGDPLQQVAAEAESVNGGTQDTASNDDTAALATATTSTPQASDRGEASSGSAPLHVKADADEDQSQVGEPGNNDGVPREPGASDDDGRVWVVLQSFMRSALTRRAVQAQGASLLTLQNFARAKLARDDARKATAPGEIPSHQRPRRRLHDAAGEAKKPHATRESKVAGSRLSAEAAAVADDAERKQRRAERDEAKKQRERDERRAAAVHKRAQKKSNQSIHAWKEREKELKREQKEQQRIQADRLRKAKEYARQTKALARRHQQTQAALLANAAALMDPNTFSSFKYETQRNFRQERAEEREQLMHLKLQEDIAIAEERLRMREQQKVAAKKQQLLAAMERREARERDLAERKAALEAQRRHVQQPLDAGPAGPPQSVNGDKRKHRKKKPLYLRMQENYHQNIVGKEEEERRRRLNSRKAKFKAVSLDEIKEHQKVHDREAAEAKKRMERKRMAALGQSELAAIGANNEGDAASPDSGLYRGRNYERVRREKEEQQLAALGPARRKQKIKQYSHLVREMYKPQIDSSKASEVAARRRKLNAQAAGPKRRTRVDLEAERKKYRGAWREVNPLASKLSAAEASWKRQQDEERRREEERLARLQKAKAEANQRMGMLNRKAAERSGRATDSRLAPLAVSPMLAEQNLHIDDDDQNAMAILNKLRKLNSLTQY